jgi:hypothetical protein
MPEYFHNPYHYVQVKKDGRADDLIREHFNNRDVGPVTHDRYVENTHSGRILCRLTAETPFFVGAERVRDATDKMPAQVRPFELDGRPAIPGSTLRGLISGLAEAASNSALRVLDNAPYFYRNTQARRRETLSAKAHDFFSGVDKELLPFTTLRDKLTIAEQLFGFVQHRLEQYGGEAAQEDPVLVLSGRMRFSNAVLERIGGQDYSSWTREDLKTKSPYLDEVTLKILGQPKPPCPSLYFTSKTGDPKYIAKNKLNPTLHEPQGRKYYLHHKIDGHVHDEIRNRTQPDPNDAPWATRPVPNRPCRTTDNCKQKTNITPVRRGSEFYFHIDFDNLSDTELALLCYALCPTEAFRHKLGMGKSIGLGTVRVDAEGLFLVKRSKRYKPEDIFAAPRYHTLWRKTADDCPGKWPTCYAEEMTCVPAKGEPDAKSPDAWRNEFMTKMSPEVKLAIEMLGDPGKLLHPVHTPQVLGPLLGSSQMEQECFHWLEANDIGTGQRQNQTLIKPQEESLAPIGTVTDSAGNPLLPFLRRHQWKG